MAKQRTPGWLRAVVIAASVALDAVACVLPAVTFCFASNGSTASGLGLLLWGWVDPQAALPWLSNFLWVAGLVLLAFGRPGWAWGSAAVGLTFASRVLLPYPGAVLLEAKWWWLAGQSVLAAGCDAACVRLWVASPACADPAEPPAAPTAAG